jgi:RNA polymerase sigma-70 factor (ECF subfamily)
LKQKIQISNQKEFQQIYLKFFNGLSNYAFSILKDKDSAKDVVQEVFLDLWRKRKELQIKTSIDAYLLRSVKFKSIDYIRKASTKQQYAASVSAQAIDYSDQLYDEDDLEERKQRISYAIAQLPPKCRKAFLMSRLQGFTYKEIAQEMNVSVKTIENQISRAFKLLRNLLNDLRSIVFLIYFL